MSSNRQYMQNLLEPKWRVFREEDFKKIDFDYKTIGEKDLIAFIDLNSRSLNTLDRTAVSVFQPFFMKSGISYEPKRCAVWIDLLARKLGPATVEHDIHAFLRKYEHRLYVVVVEKHGIGYEVMADLQTLLPNTTIHGSTRSRSKEEVFHACDQFVEQHHIFLENEDRDFHDVAFDEFEKIHTHIDHSDDIADNVSDCVMWRCEKNRLGIPCPDDMYNHELLKKDDTVSVISIRARAPFFCLSVGDY